VTSETHLLRGTLFSQCCSLTAKVQSFMEVSGPASYLLHPPSVAHWQVFSFFTIADIYKNNIQGSHNSWF